MIDSHHFAIVTRDETWSLDRRTVIESKLIHGSADQRGSGIEARDDRDDELLALCDRESNRVREVVASLREGSARAVISARREGKAIETAATISLTLLDLSVVTTLPHLLEDYELLANLALAPGGADYDHGTPAWWLNGSGAVLMHEAAGHPAELDRPAIDWPSWLRIEAPLSLRRESFTDIPLRRMTHVAITSVEAGFGPPSPATYAEILLVAGGRYEPLTDRVSLSISAANLIDGNLTVRLRPFVIDESRETIARALRSASGDVRRYPGVICSKEGQNVFVGSRAPDLLTDFR